MVCEASLAWTPVLHHMHDDKLHMDITKSVGRYRGMLLWCAGSMDDSETASDEGSPLGPKGGGTLKTCAICIEDYRYGVKVSFHSVMELATCVNSSTA